MSKIKKVTQKLTAVGLSLILVVMLGMSTFPLHVLAEGENPLTTGQTEQIETLEQKTEQEELPEPEGADESVAEVDITADFTDRNFRAAVRERVGIQANDPILKSQVVVITYLHIENREIASLACIEHFMALEELRAGNNLLTSIDVSNNRALRLLDVTQNQLTVLNVSNNLGLAGLMAGNNQLTSIDVSNNLALQGLDVYNNRLTTLDVSNNPAIVELWAWRNQLTSIDVSNNPELVWIDVIDNQLASIDVSRTPALANLSVGGNRLTNLDVSNNPELVVLWANNNQLTNLDLRNNPQLQWLVVANNRLTTLDLSNNRVLDSLDVSRNYIPSLNSIAGLRNTLLQAVDTYTTPGQNIFQGFRFSPQNILEAGSVSDGLADAIKHGSTIVLVDGATTTVTVEELATIRDGDEGVLHIILPNGLPITISDISANPVGINLNIDIDTSGAATTVYGGVQVPANSIIINPTASGEFGFTISFSISANDLRDAGLDTGTVNLFHISSTGEVTDRTQLMERNPDGSITINISSASRYVLSTTTPAPPTVLAQAAQGAPQTGVTRQIVLPIVLALLGLALIIGAETYRRIKKKTAER